MRSRSSEDVAASRRLCSFKSLFPEEIEPNFDGFVSVPFIQETNISDDNTTVTVEVKYKLWCTKLDMCISLNKHTNVELLQSILVEYLQIELNFTSTKFDLYEHFFKY